MTRELTPDELAKEQSALRAAELSAQYDKGHIDLIRKLAESYVRGLGIGASLFLARVILATIAKAKFDGQPRADQIGTVAMARAATAAMDALENRAALRLARQGDGVIDLPVKP